MKNKIIASLVALSSAFVFSYVSSLQAKANQQIMGFPDVQECKVSKDNIDCTEINFIPFL